MNKLQLIDADTLYYKPLAHPKMLIDGVLSDGLAILAGDSKIGKSWMVLWLCLQISRGEAVWGLPTRKTPAPPAPQSFPGFGNKSKPPIT